MSPLLKNVINVHETAIEIFKILIFPLSYVRTENLQGKRVGDIFELITSARTITFRRKQRAYELTYVFKGLFATI